MPGLAQGSIEQSVQSTLSSIGTDDRILGIGQHHRSLIKPDAFHVTALFQPTLAFLDRIVDILPSGVEAARSSGAVLDEFVLKVYLPQLEEKVSSLFHQAVTGMSYSFWYRFRDPYFKTGPEAFQPDPSSTQLSPQALIKAGFVTVDYCCLSLLIDIV